MLLLETVAVRAAPGDKPESRLLLGPAGDPGAGEELRMPGEEGTAEGGGGEEPNMEFRSPEDLFGEAATMLVVVGTFAFSEFDD